MKHWEEATGIYGRPTDRGIDGSREGMGTKNEGEEDVCGCVYVLGQVGVLEREGEMQEMVGNS